MAQEDNLERLCLVLAPAQSLPCLYLAMPSSLNIQVGFGKGGALGARLFCLHSV